ncbi:MAG: N-acetylglucosamine-6-phosphate deacetylase [Firmicutes bacterium]|nr:N-acetylglucosamine-6-phosphate deacetylase [Bacillota bacterium]
MVKCSTQKRDTETEFYLVNGQVITPYRMIAPGGVHVKGEYIQRVFAMADGHIPEGAKVIDVRGAWIMPGLIDMHLHGGGGADVMDGSAAAIRTIARIHAEGGTTAILPTTLTSSLRELRLALDACKLVSTERAKGARLLGVHLEGPYFAHAQRGAQDPRYIKNPEPDEYLALLNDYPFIKRISAAPELPGALELGRELRKRGVLAAIGHTDATHDEVIAAVEAGYSHMTHLYSGMAGVRRFNCYRVAGAIESGLLLDDVTVEVIADGKHLPASLLKLIYKCKGAERMALCSDALRAAGMPEGRYFLGSGEDGQEILVEEGVAWLADKSAFAGSVVRGNQLIKTMVELAEVPIQAAVKMATITPARILHVDNVMGSLDQGKYADITILRDDFSVVSTIVGGRSVYSS